MSRDIIELNFEIKKLQAEIEKIKSVMIHIKEREAKIEELRTEKNRILRNAYLNGRIIEEIADDFHVPLSAVQYAIADHNKYLGPIDNKPRF